jgi:hypothetical protein
MMRRPGIKEDWLHVKVEQEFGKITKLKLRN